MQYRIVETTDRQHSGAIVEIEQGQNILLMPDGDEVKIMKILPMGDNYFKLVSFNYVAILEQIVE